MYGGLKPVGPIDMNSQLCQKKTMRLKALKIIWQT